MPPLPAGLPPPGLGRLRTAGLQSGSASPQAAIAALRRLDLSQRLELWKAPYLLAAAQGEAGASAASGSKPPSGGWKRAYLNLTVGGWLALFLLSLLF